MGSARQTTRILAALQSQTLLGRSFRLRISLFCSSQSNIDVFVPFDLESTWSAALVLLIAPAIDPSLRKNHEVSLRTALDVLNEMSSVGNSIAASRQREIMQLKDTLAALQSMNARENTSAEPSAYNQTNTLVFPYLKEQQSDGLGFIQSEVEYASVHSFDMEEVLSSEQLEAVANAMNLDSLDWTWAASSMEHLDPSLL